MSTQHPPDGIQSAPRGARYHSDVIYVFPAVTSYPQGRGEGRPCATEPSLKVNIRLTTSGTKALQARRSYVRSLDIFTQSWRDDPGRPCLQLASRLSAPRARGCVGEGEGPPSCSSPSCSMTSGTFFAHNLCVLHVEYGGSCHCQRPSASVRRPLVLATSGHWQP